MENLKYTEILQLNKSLAGTIDGKPYKVGLLSNITINAANEIFELGLRLNKIEPEITIGNYDNIVQDTLTFNNNDLVVIFYDMMGFIDNVSGFFEDLSDENYQALQQKLFAEIDMIFLNLKKVPSVIFNSFSSSYFIQNYTANTKADAFVTEANAYINAHLANNTTIVNIDRIFAKLGIKQAIDMRFYHSSKAPYTVGFFKAYFEAITPVILRSSGKLKKAVIFDCDNTLWKGVIGEDGMENIDMSATSNYGKYFNTVQQMAVFLSKRGVIVGICSKNNEEDVVEVFKNHKDMFLTDEHIVIKKVNWQDKATNLRNIAKELNIGLDSLVFVDDSSFEINLIKEQLPEVLAVQVPTNAAEYPDALLKTIYKYFDLRVNKEDAAKTEMYKQQFQRENAKDSFGSIDDYLASLEMVITIGVNNYAHIPRVAQLTQKTNQFNLTTYRYTESQVEQFLQDGDLIYTLAARDKFGDNGLTGMAIIKMDKENAGTAIIDSLMMSCRIIGRNIEYVFINKILEALKQKGFTKVLAKYISTKKNAQVAAYYDKPGFTLIKEEDGTKDYILSLVDFMPADYNYIKTETE